MIAKAHHIAALLNSMEEALLEAHLYPVQTRRYQAFRFYQIHKAQLEVTVLLLVFTRRLMVIIAYMLKMFIICH